MITEYRTGNLEMRKYVARLERHITILERLLYQETVRQTTLSRLREQVVRLKEQIESCETARKAVLIQNDYLGKENKRLIEQLNYYAPPMPTNKADPK